MDGLDRITEEIIRSANAEAEEILNTAKTQADGLLAQARGEAAKARDESTAAGDKQVQMIFAARESSLALKRRQALLETKQTILNETLEKAKAAVLALPDAKYFSLCQKIAAAYAQNNTGEIFFNEKDKARLPKDFTKDLGVVLAERTVPIDGGFILKYGDVEENCSVSAIFQTRRDEFVDLIRDILF